MNVSAQALALRAAARLFLPPGQLGQRAVIKGMLKFAVHGVPRQVTVPISPDKQWDSMTLAPFQAP